MTNDVTYAVLKDTYDRDLALILEDVVEICNTLEKAINVASAISGVPIGRIDCHDIADILAYCEIARVSVRKEQDIYGQPIELETSIEIIWQP